MYPAIFILIMLMLLMPTVGIAVVVGWLAGRWGLLVFFLVPAVSMLIRAVRCREPRAWLWPVFGAVWAVYVWMALPVGICMGVTRCRADGG